MINFNSQFNIDTAISYGDKSISHRALMLASIAQGVSKIENLSLCDDLMTTANCLRRLGAKIEIVGKTATVTPIGTPCDNVTLDCGNSGTTARLLAGLVCGLGINATFVGDKSLSRRPMDRVTKPLQQLGANICKQEGALFAVKPAKLVGATVVANVNSAQVKSAVLLAGLFAEGQTQYVEKTPTRNHTELMIAGCGGAIVGTAVQKGALKPLNLTIPNDISSASYLLALALLTNKNITLPNVGVNQFRSGFLTVLQRAGAKITLQNEHLVCGERVADICLEGGKISPIYATATDVVNAIDEIPILATIALATVGTHTFCEVGELQHQECNRTEAIMALAKACGQGAHFDGVNLTVYSNGILPQKAHFHTFDDHRIAMCGAVLAIASGGGSVDNFPVKISFPEFLQAVGVHPKRFAVVGSDVSKSLSPLLHMTLAKKADLCCSYDVASLEENISNDQLLQVLSSFDGANVTLPFKGRVARLFGANCPSVNTIGKGIDAQSTDYYGVATALAENGVDVIGKPLWIVGAGGAAEAIVFHLQDKCPMQIVNRTAENAQRLTKKYNLATDITEPFGVLSFVPECAFEKQISLPKSAQFVFISAYHGQSGLVNQAKQRGITVVDGLQMLYHQGAKSFSLWTDTQLQKDYQDFASALQKD